MSKRNRKKGKCKPAPVEEAGEPVDGIEEEYNGTPRPEIKKTLLMIGIVLSAIGLFGVMGLRTGIVQYLLGDSNPYPGIGTAEPMGHIVSIVPLVIGLLAIGLWGIKSDPIYAQIEKMKTLSTGNPPDRDSASDSIEESDDGPGGQHLDPNISSESIADSRDSGALASDHETMSLQLDSPELTSSELKMQFIEELRFDKCNKALKEASILLADAERLRMLVQGGMSGQEFADEIAWATDRWKLMQESETDEIKLTGKLENELVFELIEIERLEKLIAGSEMLPDDRQRIRTMIASGLSSEELETEIERAIRKLKGKKQENNLTSDEKASILEDALVNDMAKLEEELNNDTDDADMEHQIMKEIEDLENF